MYHLSTGKWDGQGSLVMFVASLNQHRRHLDAGQRAFVAQEIEKCLGEEASRKEQQRKREMSFQLIEKSKTINPVLPQIHAAKQSAKIAGTNHQYVVDAKRITERAPELKSLVMDRVMSLPDATKCNKMRHFCANRSDFCKPLC